MQRVRIPLLRTSQCEHALGAPHIHAAPLSCRHAQTTSEWHVMAAGRHAESCKPAICTNRAAPRVAVRVWFWLRCGVLDPAAAVLLPLHAPALTVERRSSRRSMHDAVPLIGPALQLSFVSSTPLPLLRALVPAHFGWSDKVRQNLWARLITGFKLARRHQSLSDTRPLPAQPLFVSSLHT